MANDFVHLHTHSEYSLLDGLGRIKKLVAEAKRLGQPALALTDHGVMHGAIEFFRACKEGEIKPIIGIESYQTVWGRPMNGRWPSNMPLPVSPVCSSPTIRFWLCRLPPSSRSAYARC